MGENKGKQLDLSKRRVIANGLNNNLTATEIAKSLNCHKSTISREVFKYRYLSFKGDDKPSLCSTCSKNISCNLKHRCGRMMCSSKCVGCKSLEICDKYLEIKCRVNGRLNLYKQKLYFTNDINANACSYDTFTHREFYFHSSFMKINFNNLTI